jgi:hypothetical protein
MSVLARTALAQEAVPVPGLVWSGLVWSGGLGKLRKKGAVCARLRCISGSKPPETSASPARADLVLIKAHKKCDPKGRMR